MQFNGKPASKSMDTILKWLLILILGCCTFGCGSNSDGSGTPPAPAQMLSGLFVDSPVSGLNYKSATLSGLTDDSGSFNYREGETVTFAIGNLVLGSATGAAMLSPISIVAGATNATNQRVNNICALLQTLDEDGNLNNGIQISTTIANIVSGRAASINLDQTAAAFTADANVTALLSALETAGAFMDTDPRPRMVMDAENAREHLQRSLSERKVVRTVYGDLRGFAPDAETWAWYGIPYAQPPLGNLRWRPPQPPTAWQGVREAAAWSDQAAQNPAYQMFGEGGMSEDCLYLNVTTPRNANNLPVMVWFHGGGFRILTGNAKSFNNTALPRKGVVVVTVVHRLGPFGYLAHPALSAESEHGVSGNYGQLDLIAALKWVKENIAAFGGNPDNVTIFGESGGGGKVISLMSSPLAAGLFHKAICQSGQAAADDTVLTPATSLAAAEARGEEIAALLGADGAQDVAAAMRALSWPQIISTLDAAGIEYSPNVDFNETLGSGWYMPQTMRAAFEQHLQNDVPFIAGANEGDMPGLITGFIEQMPWIADYNDSPVYTYVFSHVPAGWQTLGGKAYHGIELVYLFNYPGSFISHYLLGLTGLSPDGTNPDTGAPIYTVQGYFARQPGWNAMDAQVADYMMSMWASFATTGNPTISSIPGADWPAYTSESDIYLNIKAQMEVKAGIAEAFPSVPAQPQ